MRAPWWYYIALPIPLKHSGIRVRPKTRKNDNFEKKTLCIKNSSPDSKADFSEKLVFGIWK